MSDHTVEIIAALAKYIAFYALSAAVVCIVVKWWFGKLCDVVFPPSHEEVCRIQAKKIVFWANVKANVHLFKSKVRRMRLRVVRFWNV